MKLLLYCTKSKPSLYKLIHKYAISSAFVEDAFNGKIVAECDYEIKDLKYSEELLKKSCLSASEIFDYIKNSNTAYEIHIKNLNIFDEPKELKDLEPKKEIHQCIHGNLIIDEELEIPIKAPQNMMRVKLRKSYYDGVPVSNDDINANEETLENYILISIRPEWLCKILNGKKTIEVRKKVLKEMLKNL